MHPSPENWLVYHEQVEKMATHQEGPKLLHGAVRAAWRGLNQTRIEEAEESSTFAQRTAIGAAAAND